jgi:hypothetical protein
VRFKAGAKTRGGVGDVGNEDHSKVILLGFSKDRAVEVPGRPEGGGVLKVCEKKGCLLNLQLGAHQGHGAGLQ